MPEITAQASGALGQSGIFVAGHNLRQARHYPLSTDTVLGFRSRSLRARIAPRSPPATALLLSVG